MNTFTIVVIVLTGLLMVYSAIMFIIGLFKKLKNRKQFKKELEAHNTENEK